MSGSPKTKAEETQEKEKKKEINVMLTCLSLLTKCDSSTKYLYSPCGENNFCHVEGYMTNEAPAKRIMEILARDSKTLDHVVMLCSDKAGETNQALQKMGKFLCNMGVKIPAEGNGAGGSTQMSHVDYLETVIGNFAKQIKNGENYLYLGKRITFEEIQINDFLDEADVTKAVEASVNYISKLAEGENTVVRLYVEFNGGPRVVSMVVMAICNLLKLRNVEIVDRSYMDFENKKKDEVMIRDMSAVFGTVDLVSGVNEYVKHGQIGMLREFFKDCRDNEIYRILQRLEDFSNNMQLCLTDYVLSEKEGIRETLEKWSRGNINNGGAEEKSTEILIAGESMEISKKTGNQTPDESTGNSEKEKTERQVYRRMFSLISKDILNGCRDLLEGDLPHMIRWCLEKNYIQQALVFYDRKMPQYFLESRIFRPTDDAVKEFLEWLSDEKALDFFADVPVPVENGRDSIEQSFGLSYLWMNAYLQKDSFNDTKRQDTDMRTELSRDSALEACAEQCAAAMAGLKSGKARTIVCSKEELENILTEYYLFRKQCEGITGSRVALADRGSLFSYKEMYDGIKCAMDRLIRLSTCENELTCSASVEERKNP